MVRCLGRPACGGKGAGTLDAARVADGAVDGAADGPAVLDASPDGGAARLQVGAWVKPISGGGPTTIAGLEAAIGRTLDYALHYDPFGQAFPSADELDDAAHGRTPIVSLGCATPADVASGLLDAAIDARAAAYAAYGHPILLRYCWEMNIHVPAVTPADFIEAWRHLHDRTIAMGATNVRWYFCPAHDTGLPYYPGDAYVDVAGWDVYDRTGAGLAATLAPSYAAYASIAKPFIVGETGARASLDQATYLDGAAGATLATAFPKIVGLNYFDAAGAIDWSLDPAGVAAFKAFAAAP
jgi:hypothetical protein